jgi:hypothetical protein
MGRRKNLTTQALAEVARRQGIRHEQERIRESWEKGLYAIRSAGSGSGTNIYPKPDFIIFNRDGVIDIVQSKTTRRYTSYFGPADWKNKILAAKRLRDLGFKVRVWLDYTLYRLGRSNSINLWFQVDQHLEDKLKVKFIPNAGGVKWYWASSNSEFGDK